MSGMGDFTDHTTLIINTLIQSRLCGDGTYVRFLRDLSTKVIVMDQICTVHLAGCTKNFKKCIEILKGLPIFSTRDFLFKRNGSSSRPTMLLPGFTSKVYGQPVRLAVRKTENDWIVNYMNECCDGMGTHHMEHVSLFEYEFTGDVNSVTNPFLPSNRVLTIDRTDFNEIVTTATRTLSQIFAPDDTECYLETRFVREGLQGTVREDLMTGVKQFSGIVRQAMALTPMTRDELDSVSNVMNSGLPTLCQTLINWCSDGKSKCGMTETLLYTMSAGDSLIQVGQKVYDWYKSSGATKLIGRLRGMSIEEIEEEQLKKEREEKAKQLAGSQNNKKQRGVIDVQGNDDGSVTEPREPREKKKKYDAQKMAHLLG